MTTIQHRRGTAAEWTSANPVLASGEFGFETDTNKFKVGNGTQAWTALSYFLNKAATDLLYAAIGSGGGGGGIGVTDADDIPDGTVKVIMLLTERDKLATVAAGATANQSDAYLLDRANHTGDVLIADMPEVTDLGTQLMEASTPDQVRAASQAFGPVVDLTPVMVVQYFSSPTDTRNYGTRTDVSTVWRGAGSTPPANKLAGDSWEIIG